MAKNVFRFGETTPVDRKVFIPAPEDFVPEVAELDVVEPEEYTGPTADDLRREAELFKERWDSEREAMIDDARREAEGIIKEAETQAFEEVRKKSEQAQRTKADAEAEARKIIEEAEANAERIVDEADGKAQAIERDAFERGRKDGEDAGFQSGQAEVNRLIERLHVIINKAIERRNEIIEESESQVIHLVLAIATKVVKVISENQKNIVVNNIVQSLRKLQAKSDVIIRVNLADLKLATEHTENILAAAEKARNISVVEDTTVDPGGCIIETDFGEIDARIASQLREIEDKILEITPIRTRPKLPSD